MLLPSTPHCSEEAYRALIPHRHTKLNASDEMCALNTKIMFCIQISAFSLVRLFIKDHWMLSLLPSSLPFNPIELPLHYGVDWRVCNVYLTLLALHFHFLQALPQYNRQLLLTEASDSSAPRPCALTPSDIRLLSGKSSKQGTLQNLLQLPMNAVVLTTWTSPAPNAVV